MDVRGDVVYGDASCLRCVIFMSHCVDASVCLPSKRHSCLLFAMRHEDVCCYYYLTMRHPCVRHASMRQECLPWKRHSVCRLLCV